VEQTLENWVKTERAGQLRGVKSEQVSADHQSQGQLLGQRLLGEAVRLAEGRAAARHGVQKPQAGEGRHARLDALVQRNQDEL
jgi:hypothetical protein